MGLREQITAQLNEWLKNCNQSEVENFCENEDKAFLLLQWKLLTNIEKRQNLTEVLENEICWILSEKEILKILLCSGYVQEHQWLAVIRYLKDILDIDPKASSGYKLKLAVAIAITFSTHLKSLARPEICIDGKKRYANFVKWAEKELLFPNFFQLTAWQLRYVVGSWAQDEELEWARKNVLV